MKKRILSLVLCAAMLLSMCLFLGAGVVQDTAVDAAEAEAPQTVRVYGGRPVPARRFRAAAGPARRARGCGQWPGRKTR